jgi:hypothetical protein
MYYSSQFKDPTEEQFFNKAVHAHKKNLLRHSGNLIWSPLIIPSAFMYAGQLHPDNQDYRCTTQSRKREKKDVAGRTQVVKLHGPSSTVFFYMYVL